jgi:hypothetical protein
MTFGWEVLDKTYLELCVVVESLYFVERNIVYRFRIGTTLFLLLAQQAKAFYARSKEA